MANVTSSELLQNILVSINSALQEPDIQNDIRSSLIDQYEKIVIFIREGYQFSDADLQDLPATIRAEVQAQLNEEKIALDISTQTLIETVNDELTQLQVLPEAIRSETNTKLNEEILTFQTESQTLTQAINDELTQLQALPEVIRSETNTRLSEEISTFQTDSQTLTQAVNDELTQLQALPEAIRAEIDAKLSSELSKLTSAIAQQQDENIAYMGNNILQMKQDLLGLQLNIQGE